MITIFAGAGASKAVDPILFPTTVEFFKNLQKPAQNIIFQEVVGYLRTQERVGGIIDIEEVLWAYSELDTFLDTATDKKSLIRWFFDRNIIAKATSQKLVDTSLIHDSVSQIKTMIKLSRDKINEEVYRHYGKIPQEKNLELNWLPLLNYFKSSGCVEIFTTNYDLVIEKTLSSIITGETLAKCIGRSTDIPTSLNISTWHNTHINTEDSIFRLSKLHGSVDWQRMDGNEIHIGTSRFVGNHDFHAIIYPGFKGEPQDEPFVSIHNHLNNIIKDTELIIFIGFAFRDEYLNYIFAQINPNAHVVVIDPSGIPKFIPSSLTKMNFTIIKHGFGEEALKRLFDRYSKSGQPTK